MHAKFLLMHALPMVFHVFFALSSLWLYFFVHQQWQMKVMKHLSQQLEPNWSPTKSFQCSMPVRTYFQWAISVLCGILSTKACILIHHRAISNSSLSPLNLLKTSGKLEFMNLFGFGTIKSSNLEVSLSMRLKKRLGPCMKVAEGQSGCTSPWTCCPLLKGTTHHMMSMASNLCWISTTMWPKSSRKCSPVKGFGLLPTKQMRSSMVKTGNSSGSLMKIIKNGWPMPPLITVKLGM